MLRDKEPLIDLNRVKNDPTLDENMRQRLSGQLPVLHIEGHPFFVDIRNDVLRPKDDFSTMGISFSAIDRYYLEDEKVYHIPYDPKTHQVREPDWDKITAIPKDLVVVEVPTRDVLDPVAYAWLNEIPRKDILQQLPMEMNRTTKTIPWEDTPVLEIIGRNLERDGKKMLKEDRESEKKQKPKKSKGKRI